MMQNPWMSFENPIKPLWSLLMPRTCYHDISGSCYDGQTRTIKPVHKFPKLFCQYLFDHKMHRKIYEIRLRLKMIGKGFYRKWVKSSFEQFTTTQTRVGSTNGRIISQNAEILKFYFSTISGNLRNLWRHIMATFMLDVPLVSSYSAFIQQIVVKSSLVYLVRMLCSVHGTSEDSWALYCA